MIDQQNGNVCSAILKRNPKWFQIFSNFIIKKPKTDVLTESIRLFLVPKENYFKFLTKRLNRAQASCRFLSSVAQEKRR